MKKSTNHVFSNVRMKKTIRPNSRPKAYSGERVRTFDQRGVPLDALLAASLWRSERELYRMFKRTV
tara:strand:+ start:898 stop:1095 length:198 start_codon:yes stop_codon:yes gene_type:complete